MHIIFVLAALASLTSAIPLDSDTAHSGVTQPLVREVQEGLSNLISRSSSWIADLGSKSLSGHRALVKRAPSLPPQVKSVVYLANVTDPGLDRDSCGSTRIGGRILWSCRDTLIWNQTSRSDQFPLVQNTAGWTNWSASAGPQITPAQQAPLGCASNGTNSIYQMTGSSYTNLQPYYPLASDMCPSGGVCSDGSRWVYWPNSPPLITTNQTAASRSAVGYTWIDKKHISGLNQLNPGPPYTLFKTTWTSTTTGLPNTSVVQDQFWKAGEIGFGNYGNFIRNGYAYLYGLNNNSDTLLARVPTNNIENRTAYQYYYQGAWGSTLPNYTNTDSTIANAGLYGGQGTFFFSSYYNRYLWIGQSGLVSSATFFLTYASAPEGPWSNYVQLFSGQNANGSFVGAYSAQVHPGMLLSSNAAEPYFYLTYTIPLSSNQSYQGSYWTPLVNVTFV